MQVMTAATLSFRVLSELANQTTALAQVLNMPISEYFCEAVLDKNVQVLKDRKVFLSKQLSAKHLLESNGMDASTGDGLK